MMVNGNVILLRKPIRETEAPSLVPPASPLLNFVIESTRRETHLTNEQTDELYRYLDWVRAQ